MKKLFLVILIISTHFFAIACDICGCGVGNNYIGILPDFSSKIFGVRYRYSSLLTHVGVGGERTYLTTNETYQTAELWGGWNLNEHVRITASIPYSFNAKETNGGINSTKNGLGDISVLGYYQLINSRHTLHNNKLLVQSLWIGGGVKAPTGKYNQSDKTGTNENANLFQLGTGSTDLLLNAMYDVRLQDVGINVSASYKINTTNHYDYSYGNKASISSQLYYKFKLANHLSIAPNAGLQFEKAKMDDDAGFNVDVSGGNILLATTGIEVICNKIAIGGNWQNPLSQSLARGFVQANNKLMVHLSMVL